MRIEFGNGRRHSILSRDGRGLRAGSGKLIQTPTATASTVVPAALSLRHNFSWTVIGNLVYALCQWGMLIVLAKLLSPEAVGQFALGLAITAPILLFTSLKLRSVLATDVGDQYRFADYLWLRLLTTLAALFVVGGIAIFAGLWPTTALVVGIVGLIKAVDSLSDIFQGLMQKAERMDRVAIGMMINGVLTLVALGSAVYVTRSIVLGVLGSLGASLAVLFVYFLPLARRSDASKQLVLSQPDFRALRALARTTWPLGVSISIGSLRSNVPSYVVQVVLGTRALGIFSALSYTVVVGSLIINALGQAATPRLARSYQTGRFNDFRALIGKLTLLGLGLGLVGVAVALMAGASLLALAYEAEYAAYSGVLVLLMGAAAVTYLYVFLGTAVSAMRLFSIQMPISMVAFLVLVVVCPLATWQFGLNGAALSLVVAALVEGALYLTVVLRSVRKPLQEQGFGPVVQDEGVRKPIRILHVFGRMNRGGAEMRTLDVMRRLNPAAHELHFCTLSGAPGVLDDEIRRLGGQVHPVKLSASFLWRFPALLRRLHIDVVHSHIHLTSGPILWLASLAGVRVRIAHFRSSSDGRSEGTARRAYRQLCRALIDRYATRIAAVSASTMRGVWGDRLEGDPRIEVVYNGVEPPALDTAGIRDAVRRGLGVMPTTPLYIHVGRMHQAKNHRRLIEIFAAIHARQPEAQLILIGRGGNEIQTEVVQRIRVHGLDSSVTLLGERSDVMDILQAADVLLFPSLWEGLPGAVLEAAAVGLPVLASDIDVMKEIAPHLPLVTCLPLSCKDEEWAELAFQLHTRGKGNGIRDRARASFREGVFVAQRAVAGHISLWEG